MERRRDEWKGLKCNIWEAAPELSGEMLALKIVKYKIFSYLECSSTAIQQILYLWCFLLKECKAFWISLFSDLKDNGFFGQKPTTVLLYGINPSELI